METLYVSKESHLSREENTLRVDLPDGGLRRFPIAALRHIVCLNSFTMTSKLLELCGEHGVRVSFFNHYGVFRGSFEPIDKSPAGEVVVRQAAMVLDPDRRLSLAKTFVGGSGRNAINLLKKVRHNRSAQSPENLDRAIDVLEELVNQCEKSRSVEDLMGREGMWRAHYYSSWTLVDDRLEMGGRVRRPPNNPINTMVSFLNQMLYANVLHQLSKTHLNATLSFLHSPSRSRASLALDVAEVFRPAVADRLIFRWTRSGVLDDTWFRQPSEGVCLLSEHGMRHVLDLWREAMEAKQGKVSIQEIIHKEWVALERVVLGLHPDYHPFTLRA